MLSGFLPERVFSFAGTPSGFKKTAKLSCRPELWYGIEFLKRGRKRVRQAPRRSGFKLLVPRRETELVNLSRQVFRDVKIPFNECGRSSTLPAVDSC